MRRRGRLRRLLPWLVSAAIVGTVGMMLHHALGVSDDDLVAEANEVRTGDPVKQTPRDPRTCLRLLEPLFERNPRHFEGRMIAARAWADLRSYDQAIANLEHAILSTKEANDLTRAMRLQVEYLTRADQFDEAAEVARRIVDLAPDDPIRPMQYGLALYKGSETAQAKVLRSFVAPERTDKDVIVEERIEAFVTDIWGDPDVDELVAFLSPAADSVQRAETAGLLLAARTRFIESTEAMAPYRDHGGFDPPVARGYTEMLLRSGRLFDAYVEAGIALNMPDLAVGLQRVFLEIQASCALALEEYGITADFYEKIVNTYIEGSDKPWAPSRSIDDVIDYRWRSEDWDWILANEPLYRRLTWNNTLFQSAMAAALQNQGRIDEAVVEILEPFATISLSTLQPTSVRAHPERRKRILFLAYELFSAVGDSRALVALDTLVEKFPDDPEPRRRRIESLLEQDLLASAMDDAFGLLTKNRRNSEDFQRWLTIANDLSLQRYGASLKERAQEIIADQQALRRSEIRAQFTVAQVNRGRSAGNQLPLPFAANLPQDPALAITLVLERVEQNDFQQARIDMRHLLEAYPHVQNFRYALGRLLVREGKLEAAAAEFRDLIADVPTDTESIDLAMRVEIGMGRPTAAADLVNAMILQDPTGVGAVRYAQQLLANEQYDVAAKLLSRLRAWLGDEAGLDVYVLSARAELALGNYEAAEAWLATLAAQHKYHPDVALLGLNIGLQRNIPNLIDAAVAILQPNAGGLFPDQVAVTAETMLDAHLYGELLAVFEPEVRELAAVRPALRYLSRAAKAVGDVDEADALLERLDDDAALLDRFVLLAIADRADEASRRLRLQHVRPENQADLDLCLLVSTALTGHREQALYDVVPTSRLRQIGLDDRYSEQELQLLDALLRITALTGHLDEVVPPNVVTSPLVTYPEAGPDVERLIALAREDSEAAAEACRSLLLALLAGDRPFWHVETRFLIAYALDIIPGLHIPSVTLARRFLDEGDSATALQVLRVLLTSEDPDVESLQLFTEASRAEGHDDWGLALLVAFQDRLDVALLLGDELSRRNRHEEALQLASDVLVQRPSDPQALGLAVRSLGALKRVNDLTQRVRAIWELHPDDAELLHTCADTLADIIRPDEGAVALLEELLEAYPDDHKLLEALARAYTGDSERAQLYLEQLVQWIESDSLDMSSSESNSKATILRRAAAIARQSDLKDLARRLNNVALQLEPGAISQFRELAFLELEEGNLDLARRYLEVLSFVDLGDKEAALALARLLFEQVGQPHLAAEVIRRSFPFNLPPMAIEILAAESFLRGDASTALTSYTKMARSPLLTADMIRTVSRIAFAAGDIEAADALYEAYLREAPADHPGRARAEWLRSQYGSKEETEGKRGKKGQAVAGL